MRSSGAGKGDTPRNCWSAAYRENYEAIFRKQPRRRQSTKHWFPDILDENGRFRHGLGDTIRSMK